MPEPFESMPVLPSEEQPPEQTFNDYYRQYERAYSEREKRELLKKMIGAAVNEKELELVEHYLPNDEYELRERIAIRMEGFQDGFKPGVHIRKNRHEPDMNMITIDPKIEEILLYAHNLQQPHRGQKLLPADAVRLACVALKKEDSYIEALPLFHKVGGRRSNYKVNLEKPQKPGFPSSLFQ